MTEKLARLCALHPWATVIAWVVALVVALGLAATLLPGSMTTEAHVTNDPDGDWAKIAPHAKHVVESYSKWTTEAYGRPAGPFAKGVKPHDLRKSGSYLCLRPDEAIKLIRELGHDRTFILTPLLGGLDPALAWRGLRLFEREVWPHVRDLQG